MNKENRESRFPSTEEGSRESEFPPTEKLLKGLDISEIFGYNASKQSYHRFSDKLANLIQIDVCCACWVQATDIKTIGESSEFRKVRKCFSKI